MERKVLANFEHEGTKYHIVHPTQDELMSIDLEQRRAFAQAIRSGLLAEFEAKKVLAERGIWGEEQETEIRDLQLRVATLETQLEREEDEKAGKKLAFNLIECRGKLLTLINEKNKLSTQTAEGYASEAKNVLFAALCTLNEDGSKVFKDIEAFMQHPDHQFTAVCFGHTMLADVGLTEEDAKVEFTENKWLESHGYMEKDMPEFTKKYYAEVIEETTGIDVNPPPPEKQKPKGRKRGRPKTKTKKE
jgi:hypothetical protein